MVFFKLQISFAVSEHIIYVSEQILRRGVRLHQGREEHEEGDMEEGAHW
jgi:hypothetical protein